MKNSQLIHFVSSILLVSMLAYTYTYCYIIILMLYIKFGMYVLFPCVRCSMHFIVADFFMGLYMVILAIVDVYYHGVYIEHAHSWQSSVLCQILGVFNTFSSEASVMTLGVISVDRFYKIVFPLHASKFGLKQV